MKHYDIWKYGIGIYEKLECSESVFLAAGIV